ncbi:MAG: Rieske (2Fe-2S) domain protein [Acidobacteria bacterium]|nr:Rieske (2Fe-2S) domain protein [Acidobacteriota bacterium]
MTVPDDPSRRALLLKLGLLFSGFVSMLLGVPIAGYLLSPVLRGRKAAYGSWVALGAVTRFPPGETRLATYRHPSLNAWDGETARTACWVRRVDDDTFKVFAVNCAHLGCPVRWFAQSGLFLCPCHGGAYYADGSRASGPPQRGLFEYAYQVDRGTLMIRAGEMPTPGSTADASRERPPCA